MQGIPDNSEAAEDLCNDMNSLVKRINQHAIAPWLIDSMTRGIPYHLQIAQIASALCKTLAIHYDITKQHYPSDTPEIFADRVKQSIMIFFDEVKT